MSLIRQFYFSLNSSSVYIPRQYGTVVQLMDGTIYSNQFIDKSGNGYHIDIINNDISLSSGFPYKSSALIAQKPGNFGLIPDPTNFWYTSGGVPNQIPVVSLFQNIDFSNQIFFKHQPQRLGTNNQEVSEAIVSQWVTYSAPLSGSNLTKANSYFNVPAEITSNVIWVDWANGNDTTGTGTKLLPYKTLTKGSLVANKTIYVKTGTYADTASVLMGGGQTWYFIGYCPATNTATPAFYTSATSNNYIEGIILTPPSAGRALYLISGNNNTAYRCKLNINGVNSKNFQVLAGTGNIIKYCILQNSGNTPHIDVRAVGLDIYGCHFSGIQSGSENTISFNTTAIVGNVNVLYNKFVNTLSANHYVFNFGVAGNYYIKYNVITTSAGAGIQTLLAGAGMTGIIQYIYNTIQPTSMTSGVIFGQSPTNVINYTITNNEFIIDISNTIINGIITLIGQPPPIINYNYIDAYISASCISINATSAKGAADISYNAILTRNDGAHIVLGSDASSAYDNCYNGSTIIGNKLYGLWYFNPSAPSVGGHGIAIFNCIDTKVKYNYVNGANHLVVIKASDRATAMVNTDCIVQYNIGINNDGSLFPKTMSGIRFYNNTTYSDNPNITNIAGGIYLLGLPGPAINNTFKNNIFIDKTPANSGCSIIQVDPATSLGGLVMTNNIYYSQNNAIARVITPGITTYTTLAQWQALGYDAGSLFQDVTFASMADEQWYPINPILNAQNLGATYENGLDVSTNWGVGTINIPLIVTKQQTGTWQNGAYVQ